MCSTLRINKICNNKVGTTRYVTPFMVTIKLLWQSRPTNYMHAFHYI